MTRSALEHVLRAAGDVTKHDRFVVIGSQAILGQFPDAPRILLQSEEADMFAMGAPELSDLLDGVLGELSAFHGTHGYYVHGISEETAHLPPGWRDRLVPVKTPDTGAATGYCLHPLDIAFSKLVAGRDQDIRFVALLMHFRMINRGELARLAKTADAEAQARFDHGFERALARLKDPEDHCAGEPDE